MSLLNSGLTAPKICEIGNFWYKFAEKGFTPLSDFHKIWLGEGIPGPHLCAKFHHFGLKNVMWAYSLKNREKS